MLEQVKREEESKVVNYYSDDYRAFLRTEDDEAKDTQDSIREAKLEVAQ